MRVALLSHLYDLRERALALGMTRTVGEIDGLIGAMR